MITVKSFDFDQLDRDEVAFKIRNEVFVEEQGVSREDEFDKFEKTSKHYLLYMNDKAIGTARWRQTSKGIKLERFALLKQYRNKGFGSVLLKAVLKDVLPLDQTTYLHAQLPAVSFYEKEGFAKQGDLFTECDIEHYLMQYKS